MNFQAISNSSVEPDSKPWESWKIKLLPWYVIWCSISCRPLCYLCMWMLHPCIISWFTSSDGTKWIIDCSTWLPARNHSQRMHEIQTDSPSLSYMMDFVPFATPQTFSRMVVLPALALPMTRMRKCGHRYRFLSIRTCASSAPMCKPRIRNVESHNVKEGAPVVAAMTDVVLGSR